METIIYVTSIKIKKSIIYMTLQSDQKLDPLSIELVCRNKMSPAAVPMVFSISHTDRTVIQTCIDTGLLRLQNDDWEIVVSSETGEYTPILDSHIRAALILFSYKIKPGHNFLFFPMGGPGHKFLLRCRPLTKYDGAGTQIRELTAFLLAKLLKPLWKKKKIWLIYEKYSSSAQDNGFYFFRYCMEQLPPQERRHIYFILDKSSPQWADMQKYKKHILPFMSFRHILYLLLADLYVASDARLHAFAWKPMPNLISREINRHDIFFLQHGVLGLKRVEALFGKNGASPMTYFAVSSDAEQRIVTEYFGYEKKHVPVVGLARWDVLEDRSDLAQKKILVMPTWRSWLEEKDDDFFCKSDYYQTYMHLFQNKELLELLKKNNTRMVFYIHPKLKEFMKSFHSESPLIQLIPFGQCPLNHLIMECSMLITDYSSVCWDVYYLEKPVIFYQFDSDLYEKTNGSYMDMEHDLFGDRCIREDQLINAVRDYIQSDFHEKEKYKKMRKDLFAFRDHNNCRRIYDFIIKNR